MSERERTRAGTIVMAAFLDLVLVHVFVTIGRSSHHETVGMAGIGSTAWPFIVALAAGWLVSLQWRHPLAVWPTGVAIWAVTVGGGLLLRVVSGQGVQFAFVLVATITLAVFLLGWRLATLLVMRRSRRRVETMTR
ncbi:DUF3054 domain-containing protein [Agromyces sp. ISL-38]|uniref:DUF3054 domain-containing protein n=1 Tax=Agromyces sp. ISL-38 TaxID=2819107 RepID=UPI001BE5B874|nr:DUF3054 domain-containing protein [Agromyces sp. ISL-38]MBT2498747.1 DUF3054 domain-containing protein [Agromyces sp. ISL-38]MBT2516565.1 DUF3054 domain-containing protein [Streptomyces sp. ISL-90]